MILSKQAGHRDQPIITDMGGFVHRSEGDKGARGGRFLTKVTVPNVRFTGGKKYCKIRMEYKAFL